jgi:hypothetical protein
MSSRSDPTAHRWLAAIALLAGCDLLTDPFRTNDASGDVYPIPVDLTSGAIRVSTSETNSGPRDSLIDVLAPITTLDTGPNAAAHAELRSLLVLGAATAPGGRSVPRARLTGTVLELHPCSPEQPSCEAGSDGATFEVKVVLGADLFAGDALRLDLQTSTLALLPDIAGDNTTRSDLCEAVFPAPFRGGGTLLYGGSEVPYGGRRIVVSACAVPLPDPEQPARLRGTDLLMVVSTALGVTLLSESAYSRYREVHPTAPDLLTLPAGGVMIPSGRVEGRTTTLPSLALVGRGTKRGACGDVCAHRCLVNQVPAAQCSCLGTLPGTPAMVSLATPIRVLVVSDAEPVLVGLRTELHPDEAEIDGIIGTELLKQVQLDIDYPNDRLLARCGAAPCSICPELPNASALAARVDQCVRCQAN